MPAPRHLIACLSALLLLAGCGAVPGSSKSVASEGNDPSAGVGTPLSQVGLPGGTTPATGTPAAGPATGDPVKDTQRAITNARQLMPGYALTMKWTQHGDTEDSSGTYAVQGMNRSLLIEIVGGDQKGDRILWQGGQNLQVKLPGLLGAVPITLGITSKQVISVRGYTIAQTSLQALLDLAEDPGQHAVALASSGPAMTLTGGKLLPNTRRLDIYASAQTGLPTRIDFWDAKQVVYHMEISGMKRKALTSLSL